MVELQLSGAGRNALGTEVMNDCLRKLGDAAGRPLLLTGAGPAFSAGLNLKEVATLDRAGAVRFLEVLDRLVNALYTYPGPTVAWVNGHAIAGGCVLALACDYRVAAPDPSCLVGLNEVALGLHFPPRILDLVRRRVPSEHLETVVLGAGLVAPTEALRLGLLDAVREDAEAHARERLTVLASHPFEAYARTKRALRPALTATPGDLAAFDKQGLASWTSQELKAKIATILRR